MNAKATDYTTILPIGKENAISTNELAVIMGFSDSRSLQTDIAKSRNAGQIILSSHKVVTIFLKMMRRCKSLWRF